MAKRKCSSPFDGNEDICVALEGYTGMKAPQPSSAEQLSLSLRKSWIHTASHTVDPLLLIVYP